MLIQLGIAQRTAFTQQRQGVGLALYLRHKALHHIKCGRLNLHLFNAGVRQANVTDQALRIQRQLSQQPFKLRANPLHCLRRKTLAQVQILHFQPLIGRTDHQVHRDVSHPATAHFGEAQLTVLFAT